jgi:hypothetical protein
MSVYNPTKLSIGFTWIMLAIGLVGVVIGLVNDVPAWLMLIAGWVCGGLSVFAVFETRVLCDGGWG